MFFMTKASWCQWLSAFFAARMATRVAAMAKPRS